MSSPKKKNRRRRETETPNHGRHRKLPRKGQLAAGVLVFAAALVFIWMRASERHDQVPPVRLSPAPTVASAQVAPNLIRDEKQVFSSYAGSASCRQCHQADFDKWSASNHGLAERPVQTAMDKVAFDPARTFHHGTQHTDVSLKEGKYEVVTLGPGNKYAPFTAERVIGNFPLREFLVSFPGGRYQTLEASYDPLRNEWFNVYGNEDRQPGEWGHWTGRGMNWNNMCAACHNTRVRKNYDEATDSYATTMIEPTVSCEACHGPMKAHVKWRQDNPKTRAIDPTLKVFTAGQVFDTCAQCHSRRMELTGDFAPGESFFDHHMLTIPDESDTYYPDGQVHNEDYEYAAFLGSKMHAAGVTCVNCHDPHTAKVLLPGNIMCMSCHSGGNPKAPVIDPLKHSFHKLDPLYTTHGWPDLAALAKRNPEDVAASGGECINCHMPQTYYMQRHRRHDHGFTIPDPLLTKEHGVPNACNRCHTDKDTDWALSWVDKWYGNKMNRPTRQRAEIIAAARDGIDSAKEGLLTMLSGTAAPYWKAVSANLLEGWAAEPDVAAALVNASKETDPLVRTYAARSLGSQVGGNIVEPTLRKLLDDPSRSVRFQAEWTLRASIDPASPEGRELLQILDYVADQPAGQMQKGAYAMARDDLQQAQEHYQKAVEWDPNSAPIRHDYAVVLSRLDRSQEAVEQLEAACRLEPGNAEFQYKLGLAWNEAGRPDKTIEALQAAVRLNPTFGSALYNLGLALNSAGQTDEALDALSRAEAAAPADPRSPYARATILVRLGRMDEAQQEARRALEIQPGFTPAQQLLQSLTQQQ